MKLTVTRRQHTHAGKTYRVGDTFEGSEALLAAFSDRLAPADQTVKTSPAVPSAPEKKRGRPKKVKDDADTANSE